MIKLSRSAMERYLSCPARYWRERIAPPNLRRKEPTTGPLVAGRAAHTVIEAIVRSARSAKKTGIDNEFTRERQLANVPRLYERAFTAELVLEPSIDWGKTGQQAEYEGGLAATIALAAAAVDQPIGAEEVPFSIAITPTVQLTGRIDAVLIDGNLVDFKTQTANRFSTYRWSLEKAALDSQPPLYALGMFHARGALPKTFTFLVAEKAAGAVVEPFLVSLIPAHLAWARLSVLVVARCIEQDVFPMPGGAACDRCFLKAEGGCKPMSLALDTP